jgi:hypothetical protein
MKTLMVLSAFLLTISPVLARSSSHSGSHAKSSTSRPKCASGTVTAKAKSSVAKHSFESSHPCPSTGKTSGPRPGYVIDHVKPLKRGGTDSLQYAMADEGRS